MKTKNGFTLIELIAVIIILGIISLLIVPAVMDTVTESEQKVALRGAENYVEAVEILIIKKAADDPIADGVYTSDELREKGVSISGGEVESGNVLIVDSKVADYSLKIGEYVVDYDSTEKEPIIGASVRPLQ